MSVPVLVEVVTGLIALVLAAMGFTNMAWSEGASSQALKRESAAKTKRLLIWAAVFAAITFLLAYLGSAAPHPTPDDSGALQQSERPASGSTAGARMAFARLSAADGPHSLVGEVVGSPFERGALVQKGVDGGGIGEALPRIDERQPGGREQAGDQLPVRG